MFAGREFEGRGRLRLTVVEMLLIGGDNRSGVDKWCIYQDVEVSGSLVDLAGRLDDEAGRLHRHLEGRGDGVAIGWVGKAH